ncbi:hypothetical protein [Pseudooceanicola sp. LIPI14-2-Ac024]|uniref:hypothetical protein n=1 Tax=Pseudooceanicola sp. LIPI14-2-Ac024 TaxID=3344875 RepID=UPI0035D00B31
MGRTAWNLALALINASLILLAVCLFLVWKVLSAAEDVSANLAATSATIQPIGTQITELTEEVAGARSDLAELRAAGQAMREQGLPEPTGELTERLDRIEGQLTELTDWVGEVREDPDAVIDRAIDAAFEELRAVVAETVALIRGAREGS